MPNHGHPSFWTFCQRDKIFIAIPFHRITSIHNESFTMSTIKSTASLTTHETENAIAISPSTNSPSSPLTCLPPLQHSQEPEASLFIQDQIADPIQSIVVPDMSIASHIATDLGTNSVSSEVASAQGQAPCASTATLPTSKLYHLSRHYADILGIEGSALLVFLAGLQKSATTYRNWKKYFYCPIDRTDCKKASSKTYRPIVDTITWQKKSAIHRHVKLLESKRLIEISKGENALWRDQTLWYSVPQHVIDDLRRHEEKHDNRYFDSKEAGLLGIRCALVLNYLYYGFQGLFQDDLSGRLELGYSAIGHELAMHESTVRKAIKKLVAMKYLSTYLDEYDKEVNSYRLMREKPQWTQNLKKRKSLTFAKKALTVECMTEDQCVAITKALTERNQLINESPSTDGLQRLTEAARKDGERRRLKQELKLAKKRSLASYLDEQQAPEPQAPKKRKRRTRSEIQKSKIEKKEAIIFLRGVPYDSE